MKELTYHPVANMFPLLEGAEFDGLCQNIRENGQIEDIVAFKGQIIDGRNRYRACKKLGIHPKIKEWCGKGSLVAYSASRNLHRRHLKDSQRAAAGVEVQEGLEAEGKARMSAGGKRKGLANSPNLQTPFNSRKAASDLCKISERSIGDAKAVKAHDPALFAELHAGTKSVNQAMRAVKRSIKSATATKAAKSLPPIDASSCDIRAVDCLKGLETVSTGSVRLVFADPPYNIGKDYGRGKDADRLAEQDYFDWCERWMQDVSRVLTPDGSAFILIDASHACEMGVQLTTSDIGLHYRNLIVWHEEFGQYTDRNFTGRARFIHYVTKTADKGLFNSDASRVPSARQTKYRDKRADSTGMVPGNVWEFPRVCDNHPERVEKVPTQVPLGLVERVVLFCSEPGDLVLDPFVGSGTTPVAAVTHGRRFVGFDNNAKYVAAATRRVQAAVAAANAGRVP